MIGKSFEAEIFSICYIQRYKVMVKIWRKSEDPWDRPSVILAGITQTSAADSAYIFLHTYTFTSTYMSFAWSVIQKKHLCNQISIAIRKGVWNILLFGLLSRKYKSAVQLFIAQEKAFQFHESHKRCFSLLEKVPTWGFSNG